MNIQIKKLSYAALCLALALVLPFLTGQIPTIGAMLSPMHIPVLLCGFLCGWQWGLAVGFVAPILRSVLFGMPKLYPTALAMMCELAVYGAATGFFYRLFPRRPWRIYLSLVLAMLLGRIVWGCAQYFLLGDKIYLADVCCRCIYQCSTRNYSASYSDPRNCLCTGKSGVYSEQQRKELAEPYENPLYRL